MKNFGVLVKSWFHAILKFMAKVIDDIDTNIYKPLKEKVSLYIDKDILEHFRKDGNLYQTRINKALRKVMEDEKKQAKKKNKEVE